MRERLVLVKAFARQYRRATKRGKGQLLDDFVAATGYHRQYAARLLRHHGRRVSGRGGVVWEGDVQKRLRRRRPRRYGEDVVVVLKRCWELLDYLCAKRLQAALPGLLEALERHRELVLKPELKAQVLAASAATIDRLLGPTRRQATLRRRGGTKPGTLLRQQIPVRTYAEWNEQVPGFMETDLVAHDGGDSHGDFAQTLVLTDVQSGWTTFAILRNKAQVWVFAELKHLRQQLPFKLLGLDSDSGSEFINHHLVRYCEEEGITFTRSRPGRKNDNCFVEQKNYSVVRRFVGYARYDREEERQLLRALYVPLHDYVNFFLPSLKLKEKLRQGSRVTKRYFPAQTPYQYLLQAPTIPKATKRALRHYFQTLNPVTLRRTIRKIQDHLLALSQRRARRAAPTAQLTAPAPTDRPTPSHLSPPPPPGP
jgi:hypothetical protein